MINVAAYARVSTDKYDQINSFESQVKYFTDYIERNKDWQLVKIYSDEGISGTTTKKRTGFNNMIKDAFLGKIDLIITKEVSRFARNTVDSLKFTRMLKEKNVFVIFLLDNIDTRDLDSELRLTIMSAIAQEESRKTSERVKWGQKRQMEKGVVFGRSLMGYEVKNGSLYLVEEEAEIIRKIFYKYVYENKGSFVIARELNEMNIPSYSKNKWSSSSVLKILKNEKYAGDICQKKTWTKSYLDHRKRYNNGDEEKIYIKDHHKEIAIISREVWDMAQERLEKQSKTKNYPGRYWASGKVICSCCSENFLCRRVRNSLFWCCQNHVKARCFRNKNCTMDKWINDKSLRAIVLYVVNYLIEDKSKIKNETANLTYYYTGKKCDEYIENILKFNDIYIDGFLKYITDKVTVHRENKADVMLKNVPYIFEAEYKQSGKADTYKTEIINLKIKELP